MGKILKVNFTKGRPKSLEEALEASEGGVLNVPHMAAMHTPAEGEVELVKDEEGDDG